MTLTVEIQKTVHGTPETEKCEWSLFEAGRTFSCAVAIARELDGYSAHALHLPGVVSCGNTQDEAIEAIRDALTGAISEYLTEGSIPWTDGAVDVGGVVCRKWIVVNV